MEIDIQVDPVEPEPRDKHNATGQDGDGTTCEAPSDNESTDNGGNSLSGEDHDVTWDTSHEQNVEGNVALDVGDQPGEKQWEQMLTTIQKYATVTVIVCGAVILPCIIFRKFLR